MATKTELETRIKQLEVENENLVRTIELVRSQRDKANSTITDMDETIEELQIDYGSLRERFDEQSTDMSATVELMATLEHDLKHVTKERDEAARRNDDLSIANTNCEMQIQQLRHEYNEAHQECVQLASQLSEAKSRANNLDRIIERFGRDVSKALFMCKQHLIVTLDLPTDKPDCEVCETSRFIYLLVDVLTCKH
jgi:chromosome segregation ATPase